LNPGGFLFLGRAETLLTHSHSFRPVDLKQRVFARAASSDLRDRLLALSPPLVSARAPDSPQVRQRLLDLSFDQAPVAQIAVDGRGCLTLANESARRLFGLGPADLGRLLQDLELSYRPVELRSLIQEAYKTGGPVQVTDVEWRGPGREQRHVEVQVVPLAESGAAMMGAAVSFLDLTHARDLRQELERAHQRLEAAYEELQSANEELETTNEELHSTVEELETTNEELQSANEEQETMNEELQSTNEELRALNDRLQQGSEEVEQANAYLRSILTSLRAAVVVMDRSLQVKLWSHKAEDLWGLRSDEVVGRPFLDLDIGLPVGELRQPLQDGLARENGSQELVVDGVNRRGRPMRYNVTSSPLRGVRGVEGMILLLEEHPRSE
jgi:two-component system CheB/CheR fusion protein